MKKLPIILGLATLTAGAFTGAMIGIDNASAQISDNQPVEERPVQTKKDINDLVINDIQNQVYTGSAITPAIIILDAQDQLEEGVDFEVAYSNNIELGTATATITGIGDYSGEITKNFEILVNINLVEFNEIPAQQFTGLSLKPNIVGTYNGINIIGVDRIDYNPQNINNYSFVIDWVNNKLVSTPDNKAKAILTGIGSFVGEKVLEFEITPKAITSLTLSTSSTTFNALNQKNAISCSVYSGGTKLTDEIDYEIKYYRNYVEGEENVETTDFTNVGVITVAAIGKGNFTGVQTANFTITPKSIDEQDIIVSGIIKNNFYNYGASIEQPNIALTLNEVELIENVDYTVSYSNNIYVGTATITITAVSGGNFESYRTETFNINKVRPTIHPTIPNITYYAGSQLPTINLEPNDTPGLFNWVDSSPIRLGEYQYAFNFIPTDSNNYATYSDFITIIGVESPYIEFPTLNNIVEYTGSTTGPTINYESNKLNISGTTQAVNVGRYEITFTPKNNYVWGDNCTGYAGTQNPLTVSWELHTIGYSGEEYIFKPTLSSSEYSYTGSNIYPVLENFDSTKMTLSGDYYATKVGTYTFTVKPKRGYFWEAPDYSNDAITFTWEII